MKRVMSAKKKELCKSYRVEYNNMHDVYTEILSFILLPETYLICPPSSFVRSLNLFSFFNYTVLVYTLIHAHTLTHMNVHIHPQSPMSIFERLSQEVSKLAKSPRTHGC